MRQSPIFWRRKPPPRPSSLSLESPIRALCDCCRYSGLDGLNLWTLLAGEGDACSLASSRIFSLKPGLSGDGYELGPPELSSRSLTGEL